MNMQVDRKPVKPISNTIITLEEHDENHEPTVEKNIKRKNYASNQNKPKEKKNIPVTRQPFTAEVRKITFNKTLFPNAKRAKDKDKKRRGSAEKKDEKDEKDENEDNEEKAEKEDLDEIDLEEAEDDTENLLDKSNIYAFRLKLFIFFAVMVCGTSGLYFLVIDSIEAPDKLRLQGAEGWYALALGIAVIATVNSIVICNEHGRAIWINVLAIFVTVPVVGGIVVVLSILSGSEIVVYATFSHSGLAVFSVILAAGTFNFRRFAYLGVANFVVVVSCLVLYFWKGKTMTTFNWIAFFLQIVFWSLGVVLEAHIILSPTGSNFKTYDWAHGAYLLYTSMLSVCMKYYLIIGQLDLD